METQTVTDRDLLRVTQTAAGRLRAERNPQRVESCLAYLDRLARYDECAPRDFPEGTPAQWAALADFAADCAHGFDWVWQWGAWAVRRHGFDPVALVIHHHILTRSTDYGHAVASFDPNPDNYRFIPVGELPGPHTLHNCHHIQDPERANRKRQQEQGRLGRLLRAIPDDEPVTLAVSAQRRVLDGSLQACPLHRSVDWNQINTIATRIRDTVRPWTIPNVSNAVTQEPVDGNTKILIGSLFFAPITWDRKDSQLENGQHRVCGLRVSHTSHALVNLT